MSEQIIIGSALILVSCILAGLIWWALEAFLDHWRGWLGRPPFGRRIALALSLAIGCSIALLTVNVWLWALAFRTLGIFIGWEPAVYFSLVSFTTLGFGDILLPVEWRLLGGMAAANGLLNFGILTAMLIETLRSVRTLQRSR